MHNKYLVILITKYRITEFKNFLVCYSFNNLSSRQLIFEIILETKSGQTIYFIAFIQ